MSLKTKLSIIFSLIVTFILIINNTLNYLSTRDILLNDQKQNMELLSYSIRDAVELSEDGSAYIEDLIGEKLRIAAIAAQSELDPDIENVSNEQLVELSEKTGVSHITLFKQVKDDIVGLKSSDPLEINLSTKEWGYWYTAFQQLFEKQEVTIPEGQKLPDYWAGPFDISTSDQGSIDKWGYYYDGTTNYIINPYIKNDELYKKFITRTGAEAIISKTLNDSDVFLEITGFNPKVFGKEPITKSQSGVEIILLENRPIYFGSYTFEDRANDLKAINKAVKTGRVTSFVTTANDKRVLKSFLPVPEAKHPYVIGMVTDYKVIQNVLNQQLLNNIAISIVILIVVYVSSYFLARYIVKPIHSILGKVDEIAEGDFGARIAINRSDELGVLSERVNFMSENLSSYTKQLHDKNKEIKYMAYHDALTSLPNRRLLNEQLQACIQDAAHTNKGLAVMFLDLDRFKAINDLFGHFSGDLLLQDVANRIASCLRSSDKVYRIGGDEFTVVLSEASRENAANIAERIIHTLAFPFKIKEQEIFITPSIGISLYPQDGTDLESLLKNADRAMYRAKDLGKNTYSFYTFEMNEVLVRKMRLEKDMRTALKNGEFHLHYQPKVDLKSDQIIGFEALIRWEHSELGMISPGEFIPLAEDIGLIVPIGEWVLQEASKQNKTWQDQGYPPVTMAVNLSAYQFQQPKLVENISNLLKETGLESKYLELEITESIALHNEEYVISKLQALKNLGIKISMDDFGTGYSSLSYLKNYPIDSLKIDQSFVKEISLDSDNEKIVTTIIAMAHNLNLPVIAEGVENKEQLYFLKQQSCNQGQGYFFSKPLPAKEVEKIMKVIAAEEQEVGV